MKRHDGDPDVAMAREPARPADGSAASTGAAADPHGVMRSVLLLLLAFAMIGTAAELVLLGHYESVWQWTPLALFGLGLITLLLAWLRPSRSVLRTFQAVMILFVASGALGLWLHYSGNAEFELEMQPTMAGRELVWKSLTGATPALAPGSMVLFGLLGLTGTYQHPRLRRRAASRVS